MKALERDLVRRRLSNQRLDRSELRKPVDVVRWLGAVQAQDYFGAKWAIGLRANGVTDADVDRAFDQGSILRTHVLRPTWHFVAPADIRWMLDLTAPRVHAANAYYYRKLELEEATLRRCRAVVERALRGGKHLTRAELASALRRSGISTDGDRLGNLMLSVELDGVVVSGPRRGKQFTYALLDERVPRARARPREEALAELTKRYFSSHGPAALADFAWWSGLTVADARAGIERVEPALAKRELDGRAYRFVASTASSPPAPPCAHLLPNYDEYLIAYKDRAPLAGASARDAYAPFFVIDGRLAGRWRRTLKKDSVVVETAPRRRLSRRENRGLAAAAERYGRFLGLPVDWKPMG